MRHISRCLGACKLLGCRRQPPAAARCCTARIPGLSSGRLDRSLIPSRFLSVSSCRGSSEDRIPGGIGASLSRTPFPARAFPYRRFTGFLSDSSLPMRDLRFLYIGHAFSTTAGEMSAGKPNGGSGKQNEKGVVKTQLGEEQITDVKILRNLAKYLWLQDNLEFRLRIVMALGLLIGAKVINVQVPFLFKLAVDWLSAVTGSASTLASFTEANFTSLAFFASPAAVLIGFGIARTGASACNELRNAVFSKVALRAIRTVSREVFSHLHNLDLRYHLSRQTGALNRIIDRGSRAINFILSAMVFNVVPTILELAMVSGILAYKYGATFAWITSLSMAAYVAFTLVVTQTLHTFSGANQEVT